MNNEQAAAIDAPGPFPVEPGEMPPGSDRRRVRDRRLPIRLAAWGTGAAATVAVAFFTVDAQTGSRDSERVAALMAREIRDLQQGARDGDRELKRLAAAVETLDHDRDRLFARVTALERDAEVATGSITRSAKTNRLRPPTDAMPSKTRPSETAPSEAISATSASAAPPLPDAPTQPAVVAPPAAEPIAPDAWTVATANAGAAAVSIAHTEFGIELGAAPTVNGLRRLWAAALKARGEDLAPLHPALAVRERPGGAVQFRLLAGPLRDAADAARLCASLAAAKRPCEPAVFDGQRLELTETEAGVAPSRAPHPRPRPTEAASVPPVPRP